MTAPEQYDRISHTDIDRFGRRFTAALVLALVVGAGLGFGVGWLASAWHSAQEVAE